MRERGKLNMTFDTLIKNYCAGCRQSVCMTYPVTIGTLWQSLKWKERAKSILFLFH